MTNLSSKTTLPIFSLLPIILLGILIAPDFPPIETEDQPLVVELLSDTIPPVVAEVELDTIITYNPETKEQTTKVVKQRKDEPNVYDRISGVGEPGTTDTLIIFNPDTGKETIRIIKN